MGVLDLDLVDPLGAGPAVVDLFDLDLDLVDLLGAGPAVVELLDLDFAVTEVLDFVEIEQVVAAAALETGYILSEVRRLY